MSAEYRRSLPVRSTGFPRKASGAVVKILLYAVIILAIAAGLWFGIGRRWFAPTTKAAGIIHVPVVRGTFVHEVNGKGNAESAKNIDITCQVEGSVTVIWIISEGEVVKEGEELVLLDSSNIEDKLNTQQSTYSTSLANVASAQATLQTAELSLEEYIEGTFQQEWTKIENTIYSSKQTQKQKGDSVRFTERLVQLGYTTTSQLDVDRVAEQSAINTVQSSLLEQLVLLKYTSEKKITELISSIETARANVDSKNYTNLLDKNRLDYYRKQFENCTIKAPQDGQVVYANQDNRRFASESEMIKEGASVRERQVLIRLPDPTQMQVKAMINESNISSVRVGMKAIIAFDAMANRTFQGTVIKVNQYPEVVWMSSAKDYVTLIRIDGPTDDLRAGLTAEIRVIAEKIDNVLMLPIQAVVEINRKTYCLQNHDGVWNYKEVLLGPTNDKQVVILAGLEEGEVVVNGARQYKNNVEFPEANTPSQFEEEKKKLNPDKPETAQSDKTKSDKNAARTPEKIPGSQAADTAAGPGKGMPGGFPGANSGARPEGGQGMPGGFPGANSGAKPEGGQGMPGGFPGANSGAKPEGGQGMPGEFPGANSGARPEGGQGMPGGFPGANSGSRPEGGQGMSGTHRRQGSDRTSG
ncbi:MAG: efflux RND transporter periplasmic adaptor subunit, partial [Thermoguttaceae bacterium]|nr:efflux RND transporter periplasmic adaptor subunit [Thermoguttaceae bacterium]